MKLKLSVIVGSLFITGLVLSSFVMKAHANPQGFYQSFISTTKTAAGNVATTSPVFMTPGTATTTVYWDSSLGGASAQGSESAVLLVQAIGSSTSATILLNQEFSQGVPGNSDINCVSTPTQCDWYQANGSTLNGNATTTGTVIYDISTVPQFSWKVSTSSPFGLGGASTNIDTRAITIQTPTRYTRVIATLKLAGTNASVWMDIVAKKQNP